jgi:hypothetical protein
MLHVPTTTTTPIVPALKKYHAQSYLEVHFWIQVAVLLLKPLYGGIRSETAVASPF